MLIGPSPDPDDSQRRKRDTGRASAVVVADVGLGAERIRVEAVGTARALRSARLHAAAAGEVEAINFTTDAMVSRGDVLLELDREAEELAVELARVRLDDSERVFDRLQRLRASGAAAQASLDDARTALEAARIDLKRAEVALADRFVVAPFDGRIGLTDVDIGDRVSSNEEIATLDDRSTLLVRFDVPEALLGLIATGDAVSIAPWSNGGSLIDGTVYDVGSRVAETTRTFVVRARIPNEDDRLRPGMSFRVLVDIRGPTRPKVPEIAIQWGGDGSFLWTVRDGIARRVPVVIVQRQEGTVLVDGAVSAGDRVVVEGLHRMREGADVEVLPPSANELPPIPARHQGAQS